MSDAALYVALEEGDLRIEPLDEAHREGLRAACAQDSEIWEIYPFCYAGEYFNPQFESLLRGGAARRVYAVLKAGEIVGMTAWIERGQPGWSIEIVGALANVSLAVTVTVIAPARCGAVPPYVTV